MNTGGALSLTKIGSGILADEGTQHLLRRHDDLQRYFGGHHDGQFRDRQ